SNKSFINVPYKSKQLNVEWLTFRDKLLPGAKEQWKLKISGPDKEKVSAELLATMYDASLDAFLPHAYSFGVYQPIFSGYLNAYGKDAFGIKTSSLYSSKSWNPYVSFISHYYNNLNLFDLRIGRRYYNRYFYDGAPGSMMQMKSLSVKGSTAAEEIAESMPIEADKKTKAEPSPAPSPIAKDTITKSTPNEVVPRKNLQETAFFFPQLQTDEEGNIILNFQMPEALTRWKFLGLAHTKNLESAVFSKTVVTQKELMVTPNAPRFLREGDVLDLSSKISNLSDRLLSGTAAITIYDAATMKDITAQFIEANRETKTFTRNFTVDSKKNTAVSWTLTIPQDVDAIVYKIVATAENFSDGEQAPLIILPNRMMVTETLPMWVNGKSKKTYKFEKLLNNKSKTLKNYNLTLEMSSQPVWYAVQALPYMMEYPYECAEQLFSRYYANTLASYIANKNPKLKTIFEQWKNTDALLSNLEKNQELKSVLLEETPWVRDAQNETEQKKRIALLFDLNKMNYEQERALQKLLQMQTPNGGFAWFPGMPDNRFITQYIVAGLGHLSKLNVIDIDKEPRIKEMLQKAVQYLDDRLREDLEQIKIYDKDYLKKDHLWYSNIQALYARSFFDFKMGKQNEDAYNYFIEQEKKFWTDQQSLYAKSMIALTLNRKNEKQIANKIIYSFKQNAINSEELGMYWKANENAGWYWYQAPVETQAMLIEAFHEVAQDEKSVDEMKVWLLKQKQTTAWKSTKATAEACYALLLQGSDWIASDKLVKVEMNGKTINPKEYDAIIEPGTGYYKINWKGDDIKQEMGKIELQKCDKGPAYGALYWQYFEDLDKITGANTSLQLSKKLFKEENTSSGKKLISITESTPLKVGDVVKVRIELRTDRNLEYVHLKDMRAAGFEPINVLSQYKYQDGLGYYESTKDVATHFFIDWMNKGIYVFEYAMRATIAGNFSNGITLIESMYAPEFKAHSKGERVNIVNNK
ncbi:MAG: alpha-2-macroglobulin, partial [Bacteroidetes bacterium]|nr:alpha-2-macroglobulin [Bacteroidota bacterium]